MKDKVYLIVEDWSSEGEHECIWRQKRGYYDFKRNGYSSRKR